MLRPTKEQRIKFNVDYKPDTDFSAYARLLQSKWREKNSLPFVKYGNFLPIDIARCGKANYLTDKIKTLVQYVVYKSKDEGQLVKEPRIWDNLLSSQPLCFNLFGELHFDLKLSTKFFRELFPERIDNVIGIKFEHSAGRRDKDYTGDHSAFDVFVEYIKNGKKGFIGIEVKYAESLREETKEKAMETFIRHQPEYTRLTTEKIFKPNAIEFLKQVPLSQIWRDHLLSIAHLKDYDEGFFVFLFPKANNDCQKAVNDYYKYLISINEELTGFFPRYLDDFIRTLRSLYETEWTKELEERYLGNDPM